MELEEKLMFEGWAKLPQFKKKVDQTKSIIKQALAIAPAYVAVSWGKDSVVMLHLCQQIKPDIIAVNYGSPEQDIVDNYSEVINNYCQRFLTNYKELIGKPEWADDPDTVQDRCNQMLEGKQTLAFVGLRAEESKNRKRSLIKNGLIHQYKSGRYAGYYRVCPLGWWGWKDIWSYTISNNLPYLNSYDYKDRERGRTNAHARYWFSANSEKQVGDGKIDLVKKYNFPLFTLLQSEGFYD
ncbi:MAG: phosphoadenosine phosphosulfate reductase family protein [Sphaerospermopsis kisseleviana]